MGEVGQALRRLAECRLRVPRGYVATFSQVDQEGSVVTVRRSTIGKTPAELPSPVERRYRVATNLLQWADQDTRRRSIVAATIN